MPPIKNNGKKTMKTLGLDVGNVWTGTALSDSLGMFAQPHKTVETKKPHTVSRATI